MSKEPSKTRNLNGIETVVHELRGPLTVISGYLEFLGRPITEEQRTHAIGSALRAVDRMQMLLNEMTTSDLDLADVRQDRILPVDPVEMAERVCAELSPLFNCRLLAGTPPPWPQADAMRLHQALANLVGNAGEHGSGEVVVTVAEDAGEIVWAVEDDGPGIPVENRQSVLAPGVRIGEPLRGRGLGLTISSAIAHAHGGRIVISDPKILTGARVELRLPLGV